MSDMSYGHLNLGLLAEQFPDGGLFNTWLRGDPIAEALGATAELQAALAAPGPERKAPLWNQVSHLAPSMPIPMQDLWWRA